MFLNHLIDAFHQCYRLRQRADDVLVMVHILNRQRAPLAILQPFMAHLIAPVMTSKSLILLQKL